MKKNLTAATAAVIIVIRKESRFGSVIKFRENVTWNV